MEGDFTVYGNGSKIMNDPIHGHMTLPSYVVKFIDTPQFQRLRELKQLGTTYYVFPGATHNRFEHSIGVSHLAGKLIRKFKEVQPELEITNQEVSMARIAGLCHDLGHGPFSHAFESWIHRVRKDKPKWRHEDMSVMMFNYLIDDNGIDIFDSSEKKYVEDLISGNSHKYSQKGWIFDIVSNSRNSIDVDKFDYLARDAYYTGKRTSFEFTRLMNLSKVVDQEIVFKETEAYDLYEMFHTRYSMFKQVYTHRVGKSVELMVADVLALADPVLALSDRVDDPVEFMSLTDAILPAIQFSKDVKLKAAQEILLNIRRRQLYPMAAEIILPQQKWHLVPPRITAEDFVQAGTGIKEEDIVVDQYVLNYALKGNRNPVDNVNFYNKKSSKVFHKRKEEVSLLIPNQFQEICVRLFCRQKEKVPQAREAFWKYFKQFDIEEPQDGL